MKEVTCDVLQEKYRELRAIGERYRKMLYQSGLGSEASRTMQEVFHKKKEELARLIAQRRSYFLHLQNQFLEDRSGVASRDLIDQYGDGDRRKALAYIFTCREDQISFSEEEALSGACVLHTGHLRPSSIDEFPKGNKFPKYVDGDFGFPRLGFFDGTVKFPNGTKLPEYISGNFFFSMPAELSDDFSFPKYVGGDIHLNERFRGHPAIDAIVSEGVIKWS